MGYRAKHGKKSTTEMSRICKIRHFPKSVSLFRPGQFKRFEVAKSATIETDGFGREGERERERKDGGAEEREARYWGQNGDKKRGQGRISYYKNTNSELPTQAGLPLFEANQPNRRTKGSFEASFSQRNSRFASLPSHGLWTHSPSSHEFRWLQILDFGSDENASQWLSSVSL